MRSTEYISEIYASQRKNLERVAALKVGAGDAPDVVQDVFATIWARGGARESLTIAYVYRATVNMAISHFRSCRRRRVVSEKFAVCMEGSTRTTSDELIDQRLRVERIRLSLEKIPKRARAIFILNRLHGCTYDEIAVAMRISYRTVEREIAVAAAACRV